MVVCGVAAILASAYLLFVILRPERF